MLSAASPSSILTLLVILSALAAQHRHTAEGLRCYICNSLNEPECRKNPPESLAEDCSVGREGRQALPDAKVCWSQHQDVKGTKVVVRQCGGLASTANGTNLATECYERVGSKGIRSYYCKCTQDLCNSAPVTKLGLLLATAALAVGTVAVRMVGL